MNKNLLFLITSILYSLTYAQVYAAELTRLAEERLANLTNIESRAKTQDLERKTRILLQQIENSHLMNTIKRDIDFQYQTPVPVIPQLEEILASAKTNREFVKPDDLGDAQYLLINGLLQQNNVLGQPEDPTLKERNKKRAEEVSQEFFKETSPLRPQLKRYKDIAQLVLETPTLEERMDFKPILLELIKSSELTPREKNKYRFYLGEINRMGHPSRGSLAYALNYYQTVTNAPQADVSPEILNWARFRLANELIRSGRIGTILDLTNTIIRDAQQIENEAQRQNLLGYTRQLRRNIFDNASQLAQEPVPQAKNQAWQLANMIIQDEQKLPAESQSLLTPAQNLLNSLNEWFTHYKGQLEQQRKRQAPQ